MAEEHRQDMPQRPAGMQGPGVVGAGNILDPEVRAEIREKLHPAMHDVRGMAMGNQTEAESPPPAQTPQHFRAGPYPHGDVDLSSLPANVPAGPVRPRRSQVGRRFYFLSESAQPAEAQPALVSPHSPGPKPG